jgi:hypothetical protein
MERGMDEWRVWAQQKWDLEGDITKNRGGSVPPCARVPYSGAPLSSFTFSLPCTPSMYRFFYPVAVSRLQRRGSAVSLFFGKRKWMASFEQGGDIARMRGRCG